MTQQEPEFEPGRMDQMLIRMEKIVGEHAPSLVTITPEQDAAMRRGYPPDHDDINHGYVRFGTLFGAGVAVIPDGDDAAAGSLDLRRASV